MLRARNTVSAIAITAIATFLFATDINAQVTSYAPQGRQTSPRFYIAFDWRWRAVTAFILSRQESFVDALCQLVSWLPKDCARVAGND
jgi:hypothetical protein